MDPRVRRAAASLLFAFACAASDAQAAAYRIRWLVGHNNLDYFEEAALSFKRAVEKGSGGDIRVDVVTEKARIGDSEAKAESPEQIASAVASGEAQMGHSFADVMGAVDPRLFAFETPFLMRNDRHMEGVIEGAVGPELLEGLRSKGLVGLSFTYSGGACGVATLRRPLRRPEDLKGLKVGVYGDAVNAAWLTALGATPVPLEHRLDRISVLVGSGELDAVVTTWRNLQLGSRVPEFKALSLPGSTYLVSLTYVNEKFFASLPPKYQALLRDASREAARIERAKTIELNERAKRQMIVKGVTPFYLDEAGRRRFVEAVRPAYEGPIAKIVGKPLLEAIEKTPDAPSSPEVPDLAAR